MTASQASRELNIKAKTIRARMKSGVEDEKLLSVERLDGKNPPRYFDFEGRSLSAVGWTKEKGLNHRTVTDRVFKQGLSIEEALTKSIKETFEHDGKSLTITEWSRFSGIPEVTLHTRVKIKKMSIADALVYVRPRKK